MEDLITKTDSLLDTRDLVLYLHSTFLTQGIDIEALTKSVEDLEAAKDEVVKAAGAQAAMSGGFRVPRHRHRSVMSHGEGLRAKSAPKAKKTIKRRVKKHAKKSHKRGRK